MNFGDFFKAATGGNVPYDYQRRLACGEKKQEEPEAAWLARGASCEPKLVSIPTGLGKTAAVVLAWLWNRMLPTLNKQPSSINPSQWPRRLVYCLPMRTLVEQTQDEIGKWLKNLTAGADDSSINGEALRDLQWLAQHSPVILMGGEDLAESKRDWDIHPERPAILIGTQDMLLSRALNRGYGMSRARWPMHFGLLNSDCLWVLDETQLMGVGVRTSAQLEGLRRKLGVSGEVVTWWASATLDKRLLQTPDHKEEVGAHALKNTDRKNPEVAKRVNAVKRLTPLSLTLTADSAKVVGPHVEKLAAAVLERHQPETITIVILNRVNRAKELFAELERLAKEQQLPELVLIHSRFRPMERKKLSAKIKEVGEKIIIATQAIEAGVDISSRTLITELAPWSSLVQRFGRCNRKGEFNETGADVFWINLEADDEKNTAALALPYTPEQLAAGRKLLRKTEAAGAGLAALEKIDEERSPEPLAEAHILRRKDLVELFDTTPDLAGLDIDVGRYIRDDKERDVQVFWRKILEPAQLDEIEPLRDELVRVSLGDIGTFLKTNKTRIWCWNVLEGEWQRLERPTPGQTYLVDYELGGYSQKIGWTGEKSKIPFEILSIEDQPKHRSPRDGQGRDDESLIEFQSLEEHTGHVVEACQELINALPVTIPWSKALLQAAQWHDVGKAHCCFQEFLRKKQDEADLKKYHNIFLAKAPWKSGKRHERPYFRHELASALAWLQVGECEDVLTKNLIAYLIAAHHGKVRLSIRAMPGEKVPENFNGQILFARGIWDGEEIFTENSGKTLTLNGRLFQPIKLDLSCMKMGEQNGNPSWSARMLSLRDDPQLGVFRLAWLETMLRAADGRASAEEAQTVAAT